MASSRTLVSREPVGLGYWRSGAAAALSVVASRPRLWLLGTVGFCLRGGILVLTLPILVLPTQVEARLLLGNYLGSAGLTAEFMALSALGGAIAFVIAVLAMAGVGYVELTAFETTVTDPDTVELRNGIAAYPPAGRRRLGLFLRLFAVQLAALLALLISALPLATGVIEATFDELLRPSSSASIYLRVLSAVRDPLFLLGAALLLIEITSSLASRHLLTAGFGFRRETLGRWWLARALASALIRPLRSPARVFGTALAGWLVALSVLVPVAWAVTAAWQSARGAFLTSTPLEDPRQAIAAGTAALMLTAVFALALLLCGFASALRAGLWTADSLH